MLQLDPLTRPSLAEIRQHEWFNGKIPTSEEVEAEFHKRRQQIQEANMRQDEAIPNVEMDPSVFEAAKAHRSVGDSGPTASDLADAKRTAQPYTPYVKSCTQFFSTHDNETLFNCLLT